MDNAVALVQAYLHVNGYFTVTEYPVIEALGGGHFQMTTDLDILALRFPGAGRMIGGKGKPTVFAPDPVLNCPPDRPDMLVGEVKEGRAELNRGARNPDVLRVMLRRFGCCPEEVGETVIRHLLHKGRATTPAGHQVRLVAFGTSVDPRAHADYAVMDLGHIVQFLQSYLRQHWEILHHAQFKESALGFLLTLEKAMHHLHPTHPDKGG